MTSQREGTGRTALVTGASAGIGMALARVFAAHGFDLVLTARRTDRLNVLAKELQDEHTIQAHVIGADLARVTACGDIVGALDQKGIRIDVLVNNAGYGIERLYRESDWDTHRDFIQVLVTSPLELTHRLLPGMTERGYGRILNIASVAGLVPGSAGHTLYGGAKAMLIKFSESLHSEQLGTGVYVSALCPGLTYSEFHDVNSTRAGMSRIPRFMWLSAERVADEGYRAVMRNDTICIPGTQYKLISGLARLLPMRLAHRIENMAARNATRR